ncbi:MAG: polysaccharide biosynthesis protein [Clostridiales bacterium]|nr:polysaccharide biosynthesis protein [Clostridiales bacterium]
MSNKTKSIVGGMTVLGLSGVICKLVGVLYSIPLTWMIGTQGLGVYNAVFPAYNLLLTVSSAGLPVAVSRLVARSIAKDDPRGAKAVFKTALLLLLGIGSIATIIMLAGSGLLAAASDQPSSRIGFQVIAPCVVIVCAMSAFRGFMQGQQNMVPTAISQLIEQVGKVFLALPMAYFGSKIGIAYGAAGALLGTTMVEGVALLYMVILYLRRRDSFSAIPQLSDEPAQSTGSISRQLLLLSLPITIGACIVPLSQYIDSIMLVGRLMSTGMTADTASSVYGLFSGTVIRIINIPTALALAVSMSLVPAISSAKAVNDGQTVIRQTDLGMRFAFLIGLPCSIGMSVLAEPLMRFFYQGSIVEEELILGGELLTMSSLTIILFTVVQATTSVLQGLGKQRIPMYTLVAGVVCKIILNYVLIAIPSINIHGAPIASLVCYTVSMVPNLYYMLKYTESRLNWMGWIVRPGVASLAMGAAVWLLRELLPVNRLTLLLEVAAGVVVYALAALAVKAITKDDLRAFRRK